MDRIQELALASPFVSNMDRNVFTLRGLPEEVVAVLFAKYSRSPRGLRETLAAALRGGDLDPTSLNHANPMDKLAATAQQFHERNVLGYGHASVAEQAIAHIAIEDVSLYAAKAIEDCRIGCAYTEQSTRYVEFDPERLVEPSLSIDLAGRRYFRGTLRYLTRSYAELFGKVLEGVAKKYPEAEKAVVKAKTCDLLRGLLPLGCLTRLGISPNARTLATMITKLRSAPQNELMDLGGEIRAEVSKDMPTLLKYADRSSYRATEWASIAPFVAGLREIGQRSNSTRLVDFDGDAEEKVLTAILYRHAQAGYHACRARVRRMTTEERAKLFEAFLQGRTEREQGGRPLETAEFVYEIVLDLGAWRDVQRHRLCTQLEQEISCDLGYDLPEELAEFEVYGAAQEVLKVAANNWKALAESHPDEAVYLVPLAYRRRFLVKMNLRQICHFVQLRSGRQGHPNYRAVAQEVYFGVAKTHPLLATAIRVDLERYALARETPPGPGKA